MSPMRPPWNHNIHYHPLVLAAAPRPCRRALDVGCGRGLLTAELAGVADHVTGIDLDGPALTHAPAAPNIEIVQGDVMTYPFEPASFDVIAAIAVLHHLPLAPALTRFQGLLAPGGVLAVIGLARQATMADFAMSATAYPVNQVLKRMKGEVEVGAPISDPKQTFDEVRTACKTVLAGARLRRLLLFRYSLVWRKPA
jgi:2-polyprenyl-3-methyl-5-hydroxy-6-metoxy-1,4-benzoquinol methylase